jgi:EmrB/QacA subfamily drug resistance transporter
MTATTVDEAPTPPPSDSAGRRVNVTVVMIGLMLAMILAMLDNMIVGTAMPKIVGELGGLSKLSWVVTAYVLGVSVSTPIWGKLGDLYGRKRVFLTSIFLFIFGSMLSGAAGEFAWLNEQVAPMTQLILFRAFQGLGAGGLMVGAFALIGDLIAPRDRGKYQGMMAGIMALSMIAGPLIGGLITDHASWRWIFYMNIPIAGAALFVLITFLHLPRRRTKHKIDWVGAGLLAIGITSVVLITTWGGNDYAWNSSTIIGLGVLALVSLALFVFVERRVAEPILPLALFKNANFSLVSAIGFLVGFGLFGAVSFLPLYMQTVQGASATNSGLLLLPMMGGVMVTSIVVGRIITAAGRYRIFPIVGGVIMLGAMLLLTRLGVDTGKPESTAYMVVLGVGMGFMMQTTLLISQNSVELKDMGVASSTATFARSIGGSFGVALFGAVFTDRMKDDITRRLGEPAAAMVDQGGGSFQPGQLDQLPSQVKEGLLHAVAYGTSGLFWWALGFAVVIPVLAWFVKEVPLRTSDDHAQAMAAME